ncbi:MAG: hypothetical protein B7Z55_05410 [Planctomycetales bacterium 12-60-4]|nr:MAG: hypothetical protein B7Z55_05410 [Planctomycetales bacterium 12-60-4]
MRISRQPNLSVCGEAATLAEALQEFERHRPDLVIVDITLKDGNGLDLIQRLKARDQNVRILVLSMHDESVYAERALRAGAMGYINKQEAREHVIDAILRVLDGKLYLSPAAQERLLTVATRGPEQLVGPAVESLTNRELEVFEAIGRGQTTSEIARQLHLSVKTVETHRQRVKAKLNLTSSAELARDAVQWVLEQGQRNG